MAISLVEGVKVTEARSSKNTSKEARGIKTECNVWALTSIEWRRFNEERGELV
jgi:hypothetical protein